MSLKYNFASLYQTCVNYQNKLIPTGLIVAGFFLLYLGFGVYSHEKSELISNQSFGEQEGWYGPKKVFAQDIETPREFYIRIPSIDLNMPIRPNVDPSKRELYLPIIEKEIAQGKSTYLPSQVAAQNWGITYLFAHREGVANFFNRIDELESNDPIYIDLNGKTYTYKMQSSRIVPPSATELYTSFSPIPLLRLQTCENGSSQRLIVDARLEAVTGKK